MSKLELLRQKYQDACKVADEADAVYERMCEEADQIRWRTFHDKNAAKEAYWAAREKQKKEERKAKRAARIAARAA